MIAVGIDAGSRAIKIVMVDVDSLETIASGVVPQGVDSDGLSGQLFSNLLTQAGRSIDDVAGVIATGYARNSIRLAGSTVTEITCHACGVHHVVPEAQTVIEIGGQDSKMLLLDANGSVRDFTMNDRCAAGTGRFLEVVAERLDVELSALGSMASRSAKPAAISSMCIVFAETEIIGLLASGAAPDDIVAGVQRSIATRVASMAGSNVRPPFVFTGGVAMISGMEKALESVIEYPVSPVPNPQYTGALGAAIIAARR